MGETLMELVHNECYKQLITKIELPDELESYFKLADELPLEEHLRCNYLLWRCSPEKFQRNLIEYNSLECVSFNTEHPDYIEFPSVYRTNDFREKVRDAQYKRSVETQEKMNNSLKGQKRSAEARQKMSEAHKGRTPWNKGKPVSEETKEKLRGANLGKKQSQATKDKRKDSMHKLKWFNNGTINVRKEVCPDGFIPGRI